MLKERDIKYLKTTQRKVFKVAMWLCTFAAVTMLIVGILNLRMAYKVKAKYNLAFIIPDRDELYMKEEYLGAHLFAQDRFLTGLIQILVGGVLMPIQLYLGWVFAGRNKRILEFIKEHSPQ